MKEFDPNSYPKKLNLGCGTDRRDDFLNIDFDTSHYPDLVGDVSDLHQLPSEYYEHIVAFDILEHIPRLKCLHTLIEWNRLLQHRGRIEIRVPDLLGLLSQFQKKENQSVEAQQVLVRNLFGTQCYLGDFHQIGFTRTLISSFLFDAGFKVLLFNEVDGWLLNVLAEKERPVEIDEIYAIGDDVTFISQAFYAKLYRYPIESDTLHYLNILESGMPREAVVEAIELSAEYSSASEVHPDCAHLLDLESDGEFVNKLFMHLLSRPTDREGLHYYETMLKKGGLRKAVINSIKSSEEYRDKNS